MLSSNLVSSFYYNNFAAAISEPFTSLNAYRAGVIDANGNILKPESSIDPFEYLIIKLKKIFAELPAGLTKAKLSSYIPALQYFAEEAASFGLSGEHVDLMIEGFIAAESNGHASYIEIIEDMGSANLGGPASSPAANTGSVTGFDLPLGGILKRKPQQSVLGFEKQACEMYDVCPEDFDLLSNPNLKAWSELPDSDTVRSIQRSQRRNGGSTIIIRDTGTNRYHKVNLMPRNISKMFEDVDLSIFKSVLHEENATLIEPETTKDGTTRNSEVWALQSVTDFLKKHYRHVPWTENPLGPGEFAVSPGGKGKKDMKLTDEEGREIPIEVKSIKSGKKYSAFNMDLSTEATPKGVATYASTAHGLVDIYDPEYAKHMEEILRDTPIENVSRMLSSRGEEFRATRIPGIKFKELEKRGNIRQLTPKESAQRVLNWRTGLLDMVGGEKEGLVLAVNPEQRHMHILNMETGEKGSSVNKLLQNLGGLELTGSASTSNVGSSMALPYPKMAKSIKGDEAKIRKSFREKGMSPEEVSKAIKTAISLGDLPPPQKMLRVDYRFNPAGSSEDPWVKNGQIIFGDQSVGQRESLRDWHKVLDRLTKAQ